MAKTLRSQRHQRFIDLLVEYRKRAGLSQAEVAEALGRYQSVVASIESGSRRVDVVELLDLAEVIGFDASELLMELSRTPSARERKNS
ncbi:MAG: helix-turn-helix transcriptional regulator [Sphingobium sp.]